MLHDWDIQTSYEVVTPASPLLLAVTREEAKEELDILDDDTVNGRIDRIIKEATEQVESDARRVAMTQTLQMNLDRFPCGVLEIRRVPVTAITHVKYLTGGMLTTLSSSLYETDLTSEPARIRPVASTTWPTTDCALNAVQIEFVAGYASQADVPPYLKRVILAVVRSLFRNCDMGANYWLMINRLQTFGVFS